MLTLPTIIADSRVSLVACLSSRQESRMLFESEFRGKAYAHLEDLLADNQVEAVYIASPHGLHRDHAVAAAEAGKHILVDKPLAISLSDAKEIVEAANQNNVCLITGPSHSFDDPVDKAARDIAAGHFGSVRMVHAFNYTDFLYRPRRPEELDTKQGGGVVFSQAVHQIDLVCRLVASPLISLSARTGNWDANRSTEGAFSALLNFQNGAFASLVYSGYAHFDSDSLQDDIGELGSTRDSFEYGKARRALAELENSSQESNLKKSRGFGEAPVPESAPFSEHFGPVIVSCDKADLKLSPKGVEVWGDLEKTFIPTPPNPAPRSNVFAGLYAAIRHGKVPIQHGSWGLRSLEACHAVLESASNQGELFHFTENNKRS